MSSDIPPYDTVDDPCASCPGDGLEEVDYAGRECPYSKRPCGHHCNHIWTHGGCDWCSAHTNDDGVFVKDRHPARDRSGFCANCVAGPTEFHRDGCWLVLDSGPSGQSHQPVDNDHA